LPEPARDLDAVLCPLCECVADRFDVFAAVPGVLMVSSESLVCAELVFDLLEKPGGHGPSHRGQNVASPTPDPHTAPGKREGRHVGRDRHDPGHAFVERLGPKWPDLEAGVGIGVECESTAGRMPDVVATGEKRLPHERAPVEAVASEPIPSAAVAKSTEGGNLATVDQIVEDVYFSGIERDRRDPGHCSAP